MPWATRSEACFSEIPLGLLDRLVERRSRYGFGFRQDVLLAAGGARVWYIDNDTPVAQAFRRLRQRDIVPWDGESPLWELTPFVDFPGEYGGTMYRFEWEREWRASRDASPSPERMSRSCSLPKLNTPPCAVRLPATHVPTLIRSGAWIAFSRRSQRCLPARKQSNQVRRDLDHRRADARPSLGQSPASVSW